MVLALAALWPTYAQLMRMTATSETYQYTWLVIPMLAYLFGWHYREALLALKPQPSYAGATLAALAAALWAISALVNIDVARQFALVVALQGIALAILGWHIYRRFFAVFALLFFLVPTGDLLQPSLRLLTVRMMEVFASTAGLANRTWEVFGMRWISSDRMPSSARTAGTQAGTMPRSSPHSSIGLARRMAGSFS